MARFVSQLLLAKSTWTYILEHFLKYRALLSQPTSDTYSLLIHPCIHLFSFYTPNQDLAFEFLNEGLSFDDIAQRLGYSVDMVLALFDDAGSTAHDDGVAVAADVVFDTLTHEQMTANETLLAVEGVRIAAAMLAVTAAEERSRVAAAELALIVAAEAAEQTVQLTEKTAAVVKAAEEAGVLRTLQEARQVAMAAGLAQQRNNAATLLQANYRGLAGRRVSLQLLREQEASVEAARDVARQAAAAKAAEELAAAKAAEEMAAANAATELAAAIAADEMAAEEVAAAIAAEESAAGIGCCQGC